MRPGRVTRGSNPSRNIVVCPASDMYKIQPGVCAGAHRERLDTPPEHATLVTIDHQRSTKVSIVVLMHTDSFPEKEKRVWLLCAENATAFGRPLSVQNLLANFGHTPRGGCEGILCVLGRSRVVAMAWNASMVPWTRLMNNSARRKHLRARGDRKHDCTIGVADDVTAETSSGRPRLGDKTRRTEHRRRTLPPQEDRLREDIDLDGCASQGVKRGRVQLSR